MPIEYKPANLSLVNKGAKQYAPSIPVPSIRAALPSLARMSTWPEYEIESTWTGLDRPGYAGNAPSMEQVGYVQFAQTRAGMGLAAPLPVVGGAASLPTYVPSSTEDISKIVIAGRSSPAPWSAKEKKTQGYLRFGSTDISMVDPLWSFSNLTGEFLGKDPALVGIGGEVADPFSWFNERDLSLANMPTRLIDYAVALPVTLLAKSLGYNTFSFNQRTTKGDSTFPFQADPLYWANLEDFMGSGRPPTDEELERVAFEEASRYSRYPEMLAEALLERFKQDRDVMVTAMSSGNERIDYMAKKELEAVLSIIEAGATGTVSIGPAKLADDPVAAAVQILNASGIMARGLLTLTPGIGTPLAEFLMPVSEEAEKAWEQLPRDVRASLLGDGMMATAMTDVWATFPLLSGGALVASAFKAGARGGNFMEWASAAGRVKFMPGITSEMATNVTTGWRAGRAIMNLAAEAAYSLAVKAPTAAKAVGWTMDATLRAMNLAMAAGVTAMTANWALENWLPGYEESIGQVVDASRPVSESQVAGFLNNIGYFSSATFGAWTAARTTTKIATTVGGKTVGRVGGSLLGEVEDRLFQMGMGGGQNVLAATRMFKQGGQDLRPDTWQLPVKSVITSELANKGRSMIVESAVRRTIGNPKLAHLPPETLVEMANAEIQLGIRNMGVNAATLGNLLLAARTNRTIWGEIALTDADRVVAGIVKKAARDVDDQMAAAFGLRYNEAVWQRTMRRVGIEPGPDMAVAYRDWVRGYAKRMGYDLDEAKLLSEIGDSPDELRKYVNLLHAHEYHVTSGRLAAAASAQPIEGRLTHPEDYYLSRADNMWQDQADLLRAAIRQRGTPEALLPDEELQRTVGRLIRSTEQLDDWWARLKDKPASPEEAPLDDLLKYLEDAYATFPGRHPVSTLDPLTRDFPVNRLARELAAEGVFAVAYKPKGSIIAYRPTPTQLAVRVSRNVPDDYVLDAPEGAYQLWGDDIVEGLFHATPVRSRVVTEGLRSRMEAGTVGLGGGMSDPGSRVSVTVNEAAAEQIAERLRTAIRASRGEITVNEIISEFPVLADDAATLANTLGAPQRIRALFNADPHSPRGNALFDQWLERSYSTPAKKYLLVKELDDELSRIYEDPLESGHVGLTASWDDMAKLDPTDVGVVRVARREGATHKEGLDPLELQYRSSDLWVVDDAARADHAGWTNDRAQPLDNQWEQPWNALTEDPTLGATPVYEHLAYVKLSDGTMVRAPWVDYPLSPANVALGNRTFMGQKFDSIFQGVRSWRMHEHQLAQAARIFNGRYGFTARQIELFKDKVDMIARSEPWSPLGKYGKIRTTPYAVTKFREKEVQRVAEGIFGKEPVLNRVTGELEAPDYARLLGDAYQQAYTLNLTSGITSRIKQFDHLMIGPTSTMIADWVVPVLRFKASMVFRTSELLESRVFNALRGTHTTPQDRLRFREAGITTSDNLLAADFGTDPMLEALFQEARGTQPITNAAAHGLDDLVDVAGTGPGASHALWRNVSELFTRKGQRGLLDDIRDPAAYKNGQMYDLQIEVVKRELPALIKARDPGAYRVLAKELKVPDDQMARFIVDDRILWEAWQDGKITFEQLLAHGRKYAGGADSPEVAATMRAIYKSEDWAAVDVLMRTAAKSAASESFGVHFFGSYRSALERSINHPLLGVYPASWAYKSAKEWARFLYDNRTFGQGQVRLGMFPMVAINELIGQVNIAVAQNTDQNWEEWLDSGPARNWLFLWNLLLPGDWSSLPFPLARPLRTISRSLITGEYDRLLPWNVASDTFFGPQGRGGIGVIRDWNLAVGGITDVYNYFTGDTNGEWDNLAEGLSLNGVRRTPPDWDSLTTFPEPFDFAYPAP